MAKASAPSIDKNWEVEDALRTLNRAEEIRKNSKMMGEVKKLAQEQIKSLSQHLVTGKPEARPVAKNALIPKGKR